MQYYIAIRKVRKEISIVAQGQRRMPTGKSQFMATPNCVNTLAKETEDSSDLKKAYSSSCASS